MTYRSKTLSALVSAVLGAGLLMPVDAAFGADATGLTLTIVSDDTASSVADTSSTNGIVPVTGGQLTYRWGWAGVPGGGDAVFSQTLPVGVTWNAASIASGCAVTGSFLTAGETLTCTLRSLADIPGTTDKTATVKNLNNGSVISSKLVSGSSESAIASVTAAATSQVQVRPYSGATAYMTDAKDPATGLISGLQVPFSFAVHVPGNSTDRHKGQESLGANATLSFPVTIPDEAQLISCGVTSVYGQNGSISGATLPAFSSGASTANNRVANTGTMSCSRSGNTVTVTFTGVDARLNHIPSNNAYFPSMGVFALGGFYIWMPGSSFSPSTSRNVTVSVPSTSFASAGGITSSSTPASVSYPIQLAEFGFNQSSASITTTSTPYPGATFTHATQLTVPSGSGQSVTNGQLCQVWDNSLQKIRDTTQPTYSSVNITPALSAASFSIEYGTHVYANETARRNADCGTLGDGSAGWFSSIAAAGGVAEVSAVRVRYNRTLDPGQFITINISMSAPTSNLLAPTTSDTSGITYLPFFNNRKSDQTAVQRLAAATTPPRAQLSKAAVRTGVAFTESDVRPGGTATVTVTPTVTTGNVLVADGRLAVGVTQTITLPNGCFTFVPGTPAPVSVTPAIPASPSAGADCTSVSGQVIVWNLGNVSTASSISPITFAVNVNPATPTPAVATITNLIASNSDKVTGSTRTATDTININTVNQFQVSLTSSSASVTSGIPFTYRAGWKNAATSDIDGSAWVVSLLPFDGDGRGTSGLGGIELDSVSTSPSDLDLEYTVDDPETVLASLQGDQSGGTGITWLSTNPGVGVSAVRVRTQALAAGAAGYMDLTVTPQNFVKGGTISNDVYAKADSLPTGFIGTEDLNLESSSSEIVGSVYQDLDYSGTLDLDDNPISGKQVRLSGFNFGVNGINNTGSSLTTLGDDEEVSLSTTTDVNGEFSFTVSPGVYTVEVDETNEISGVLSDLITYPNPRFEVSGAVTVSGKNFGFQEPISPPVAVDDNPDSDSGLVIYQGESVDIDILANDTTYVPEGVPATQIESHTEPARGAIVFDEADVVTYTANAVWPGSVSGTSYESTFEYTLSNPQGSSSATVTVRVLRLPSATADALVAGYQLTASKSVLANDFGIGIDFDNGFTVDALGNGSAVISGDQIAYTSGPRLWADGETSFTEEVSYGIVDTNGRTASGTMTVTVYRAPEVADDSATIAYESNVDIDVLSNDLSGRSSLSLAITSAPLQGTAEVVEDEIRFTAGSGQTGPVTFEYSVTDDLLQIGTATVTVTIVDELLAVDDGSVGTPIRVDQGSTILDVLGNDFGSDIEITSVQDPANGAAVIEAGRITFTPTAGYEGAESFSYTITDSLGSTDNAVVYLDVIRTAGKPGTPTSVAGNASATVTVVPPSTGETPTSYTVISNPGGLTCELTPPVTSCVVLGLTNGTNYTFTVTAYVGDTASVSSDPSPSVRPLEPPSNLAAPTAIGGNGSVSLSWDPPLTGTAPFNYTVQVSPDTDPSSVSCVVSNSGVGTTAVCSGLINGSEYRFQITADNGVPPTTQSELSAPVIPTAPPNRPRPSVPTPTALPAAPTRSEILLSGAERDLRVSIIGQLVSGVSEYSIRLVPGNLGCNVSLPQTICDIQGPKELTDYRVIVSASNQLGSSPERVLKTRLFLSPDGWLEFKKNRKVTNLATKPKATDQATRTLLINFAERHDDAQHFTCIARTPKGVANERLIESAAGRARATCRILNSANPEATFDIKVKLAKSTAQSVAKKISIRLYVPIVEN